MTRYLTPTVFLALSATLTTLLSACGAPSAASNTSTPTATEAFSVKFSATVKGQAFRCGQDYTGIGTSASTIRARDFRFYVSAPRLVAADGSETPITLKNDGKWQHQNVALLDFEDGTGGCEGNLDTNFTLSGSVPAQSLKPGMSLRFELGLPFALNHGDASRAASPLNLTSMFWTWRGGYKFARLDLTSTGQPQGYFIHIGSTGCTGDMKVQHDGHEETPVATSTASPASTPAAAHGSVHGAADSSASQPPASCSAPNRATITLSGFDAGKQHVEADLGRLLSENDVNANQPETPAGCMSGSDDSDCKGIFKQLGLGSDKNVQGFFALKSN